MALTETDALAQAEAEVRAYCGWHIAPERTDTLTLDGPGSAVLLLPSLKVSDISELLEDGNLVDPSSYEWSESGMVRRHGSTAPLATGARWTRRLRGVKITLTHGFREMPLDVGGIIERLAARAVELSEASQVLSQVGQIRYAVGVDGFRETGLLSDADRWVLNRYRLPRLP